MFPNHTCSSGLSGTDGVGASRGSGGAQPLDSSARATLDCSTTVGQRVPTLRVRTHLGDGLRGFDGLHQACTSHVGALRSTSILLRALPVGPCTCVCARARPRMLGPMWKTQGPIQKHKLTSFWKCKQGTHQSTCRLARFQRREEKVWQWQRAWGCGKGWREGEPFSGKDSWCPIPHPPSAETRVWRGLGLSQELECSWKGGGREAVPGTKSDLPSPNLAAAGR